MTYYAYLDSPIGRLLLTSDGAALTGLYLEQSQSAPPISADWIERPTTAPFPETIRQMQAYFDGTQADFDLPLAPCGTTFQKRVWEELRKIPYGTTISYSELAQRIGAPNAARAVGLANGKNPISVIVPCHRVIGAQGKLTGYSGGVSRKERLLRHEGALK